MFPNFFIGCPCNLALLGAKIYQIKLLQRNVDPLGGGKNPAVAFNYIPIKRKYGSIKMLQKSVLGTFMKTKFLFTLSLFAQTFK